MKIRHCPSKFHGDGQDAMEMKPFHLHRTIAMHDLISVSSIHSLRPAPLWELQLVVGPAKHARKPRKMSGYRSIFMLS